jgi:hypothetical protein
VESVFGNEEEPEAEAAVSAVPETPAA